MSLEMKRWSFGVQPEVVSSSTAVPSPLLCLSCRGSRSSPSEVGKLYGVKWTEKRTGAAKGKRTKENKDIKKKSKRSKLKK